jgi:hypothetical protein
MPIGGTAVRLPGLWVRDGPSLPSLNLSLATFPLFLPASLVRVFTDSRFSSLTVGPPPVIGRRSRSPSLMLAEPAGYGLDRTAQTLPARQSRSLPSSFSSPSSLPCSLFCLTCPRWHPHPRLPPNPRLVPRLQRPRLNPCRSLESLWMGSMSSSISSCQCCLPICLPNTSPAH